MERDCLKTQRIECSPVGKKNLGWRVVPHFLCLNHRSRCATPAVSGNKLVSLSQEAGLGWQDRRPYLTV